MKFGLSVPFRTLLNAESEHLGIHRVEASNALEKAFEGLADGADVESLNVLEPSDDDTKRGLKTLSDDSIPWFCRPLVSLKLSESYFHKVVMALKHLYNGTDWESAAASVTLEGFVDCFDNTLAVGCFQGTVDLSRVPTAAEAQDFERFLSNLGEKAVEHINNQILAEPLEILSKRKIAGDLNFSRPRNAYQTFSDLNHHPFPRWDEHSSAFFWAHRVYVSDEEIRNSASARKILRLEEITAQGAKVKEDCFLHVGSSLVGHPATVSEFLKSCAISQYFYCLFDILNSNQNKIYREIASKHKMTELRSSIQKYNRMEDFIDYAANELSNTEISLQGSRRILFACLNDVFGTRNILSALQARDALVQSRLDRRSFLLQRSDRRTLRFVLFLLGGAQVMQLVIDLFDYASEPRSFEIVGLYDAFHWMDFNIAMHAVALLVLAGALYATINRE